MDKDIYLLLVVAYLAIISIIPIFAKILDRCFGEGELPQRRHNSVLHGHDPMPTFQDAGLEPKVLDSLPIIIYSTAMAGQLPAECIMCLSEFEEREIVRLLPKCNHAFHMECIDMWFSSHSTCPVCRLRVQVGAADKQPMSRIVVERGEGRTALRI